MRNAVIAGVGMTSFGKFIDRSVRSLATEAVNAALADGSVPMNEIGAVFFANATSGLITGQECVRGQVALRETELLGKPILNVENACASGSTAFNLAWRSVASGQYDVALAVGAEKMTHEDKTVTFNAIESGVDMEEAAELKGRINGEAGPPTKSLFMDIYSDLARDYMSRTGATAEDFARISVKSHLFGSLNSKAQFRQQVTVGEVLDSRPISPPLTLLMCSPIGDGAAAIVVTSEDYARRVGAAAVNVRACELVSGEGSVVSTPAVLRAAAAAYESAGVGPEDVDVVELHDATASAEMMIYEELGLCAPDGGPELLRSGTTELNGKTPVNPSGGLLSKGHPVGASGCAQLVELTNQLRGRAGKRQREGARVVLAENGGGFVGRDVAAANVTILAA